MWRSQTPLLTLSIALLVTACANQESEEPAQRSKQAKPTVYVVNYPLQYFAERIGAAHVDVVFLEEPEVDPAFWKPQPQQIVAYQSADLILLNGANYARWVATTSLPQSRLVDTSGSFAKDYIGFEDAVTHSHGPGGEHAHTGTASTTWLDLSQAAAQAQAITDAFVAHWPKHAEAFVAASRVLQADLLALDREIAAVVDGDQQPIVASHPVYQYFARRYGVNLQSVMWETNEVPSELQWAELRGLLELHPARWMLWEGAPGSESASRLQALGVASVVFHPCSNMLYDRDFLDVMRENVQSLKRVYGQ